MKFGVFKILKSHLKTLKNARTNRVSKLDLFLFFVAPAAAALAITYSGILIDRSTYGVSISVFAIFSALLLSVQIAIYSIFRSEKLEARDRVSRLIDSDREENERVLLQEINEC